jgi:hypothetical protein
VWNWTCPKTPKVIWEHHSWTSLNEMLTRHEDGTDIPGIMSIPPCEEEHNYWDDGVPCHKGKGKGCHIPYVRDDEPVEARSSTERR